MLRDIMHRRPAPCSAKHRAIIVVWRPDERKMGQTGERKRTGNKFAIDLIRFSRLPVIAIRAEPRRPGHVVQYRWRVFFLI